MEVNSGTQVEAKYRQMLETLREDLVSSVREYGQLVLDAESQATRGDPADRGNSRYDVELFGAFLVKQAYALEEIEAALEKMTQGNYGTCEACRNAIAAERLEAMPWAKLCRSCQQEQDRRQAGKANRIQITTFSAVEN